MERRKGSDALRIVVVDDERDTVDTLKTILEDEGHVVLGVYGGKDTLSTVPMFRPDVMIMDIAVPGLSGYAVAQIVRYSFLDLRRPVLIAMSGMWKESADRRLAQQVGFDHYFEKPCDPARLLRVLRNFQPAP
jgi:DNA-binding response OmpR family regulator